MDATSGAIFVRLRLFLSTRLLFSRKTSSRCHACENCVSVVCLWHAFLRCIHSGGFFRPKNLTPPHAVFPTATIAFCFYEKLMIINFEISCRLVHPFKNLVLSGWQQCHLTPETNSKRMKHSC